MTIFYIFTGQQACPVCFFVWMICSCDDVERREGISNCKMDRKLKTSGFRFLTTASWEKMCVVIPILDYFAPPV